MPNLRVSLHLNLRHLFFGAVLQVQKVLRGGGYTDPHGALLKVNWGVSTRTGVEVEPPTPRQFSPCVEHGSIKIRKACGYTGILQYGY